MEQVIVNHEAIPTPSTSNLLTPPKPRAINHYNQAQVLLIDLD